jgi:hypothetical protein
MAGPSNPHRRLPTSATGRAQHRRRPAEARAQEAAGLMPDGAVVIAAITSCTNTSNPRNVIAAGLLARNANRLGLKRKPWVKTSLAPGSKAVELYLQEAGLLSELEQLGFGIVGLRLHHLQRHVGRAGPEDPAGDHRARPVRHRGALGQPQLRRPHPSVCEAGLPRVAAAGGGLCHRGHDALRHRARRARRGRRQGDPPAGPVAQRRGDRRHRRGLGAARDVPQGVRAHVRDPCRQRREGEPAVRLAPAVHLHPPPALLGQRGRGRAGRRAAHAARHAAAGHPAGQHHHRPPVALQRDPAGQRRRRVPAQDGPAGRRLQLVRHAPRRPPDGHARHLRQPAAGQRDGGGGRRADEGARSRASSPKARSCACGRPSRPTWRAGSR